MTASVGAHATGTRHPVVELFGPTIQGEGPDAGRPCLFVRFGGCDYRCSWCDSMHAVEPARVRDEARRLTDAEIVAELADLSIGLDGLLVVLSGGNPALHDLGDLVRLLRSLGAVVSVETQGSIWRDWLADVDRLIVSPKPPSSGMDTADNRAHGERFRTMARAATATSGTAMALKVVCFDACDVEFALDLAEEQGAEEPGAAGAGRLPLYLSTGTDVVPDPPVESIAKRFRWLCEHVAAEPRAKNTVVLPQLHVIAWGSEKGR